MRSDESSAASRENGGRRRTATWTRSSEAEGYGDAGGSEVVDAPRRSTAGTKLVVVADAQ